MIKKHSKNHPVRLVLTLFLCSAFVLSGCSTKQNIKTDGPGTASGAPSATTSGSNSSAGAAGAPTSGNGSSGTAATKAPAKGSGPEGLWYEQEEFGGTLTVTDKKLIYKNEHFSDEITYKKGKKKQGEIELIPDEEYWYYIDIFYDSNQDIITAHDLPHTDGDGGYHLHTFARTEYEAPPEPVYGERHDNSDPNAQKEFSNVSIRSITFTVQEPIRPNGDMAPEQPDYGKYSYELTASEDGSAVLSSDFCQQITVTKEQMEELAKLFEGSALPSLNGIDIYTEEMPEDTTEYTLSMDFESGEHYYSHANGKDVSQEWLMDGYTFHQYLFYLFVDAGYNIWNHEFHSTQPMKRIGYPEGESAGYSILLDKVRPTKTGTAYNYDVHCDYPLFQFEGDAPEGLQKGLQQLSDYYKELALADLERDYAEMAEVPKSVWKKADHLYAYSFYAVERFEVLKNMVTIFVSEGHSNSLGIGKYGYGYYPNHFLAFDAESGKQLSLTDLFTDTEQFQKAFTEMICEEYGHSPEYQEYFRSEKYQALLKKDLSRPFMKGGIGFECSFHGIDIHCPNELSRKGDYSMYFTLYYDRFQDLLNDRYCSIY